MSYPSIISQPGSAQRNLEPIIEALKPLIERDNTSVRQRRVLELASFPYEHISAFAQKWPDIEWHGTCRDGNEVQDVNDMLFSSEGGSSTASAKLRPPRVLDVSNDQHWDGLLHDMQTEAHDSVAFEGVIALNLIHCCPPDVPEHIFRRLSPYSSSGKKLLDCDDGWIAAYGAYKNDDGTYKSEADKQFEASHIQAQDSSLGLRTIKSITEMAEKWGFAEESRVEMPKGNMWVVWRAKGSSG